MLRFFNIYLSFFVCEASSNFAGADVQKPQDQVDIGELTTARVESLFDKDRMALLLPALDNTTSAEQAIAVNNLLGVNFIPGWPTGNPEACQTAGMCRLGTTRAWDFPFDHGLRCNMPLEWLFFVGTFDLGEEVVGYELLIFFNKLSPSSQCDCDYAEDYTPGGQMRLNDSTGRLVEAQLSVVTAPKLSNGSAVGEAAKHTNAPVHAQWWTGLEADSSIGDAPWGFRVGPYTVTASTTELRNLVVKGSNGDVGIDLTLNRKAPLLLVDGSGFIGSPEIGAGQGYYSLVGLETFGTITSGEKSYTISGTGGLSWMDHQFGAVGMPTTRAEQLVTYLAYTVGKTNINPVNMGFGVPGTENWFGLHFQNASGYQGALSAVLVAYKTWEHRTDQNQNVPVAEFMDATGVQHHVNYSYSVTRSFISADGSSYGRAFRFTKWPNTDGRGLPDVFDVESLADDSRVSWASGGYFYEGAVELRDPATGTIIGHGYTESVGWDRNQITATVGKALRQQTPSEADVNLLSSRSPLTQPPAH